MSLNVCMFTGNLTRDVELRDVGSTKVGSFGLAVSEKMLNYIFE
jgi:single-stranded DNA-binding protein